MSNKEDEPIIVRPSKPIIVRPKEAMVIGPPIWMRQELGERGKNTCFPTSVINASIAVGAIKPENAVDAYEVIMKDLLRVPDLWHGPNLVISNASTYLQNLIEYQLPIRIGYKENGLNLITISHTFSQILEELNGPLRHVLVNRNAAHAYATINRTQNTIVYIDATDPTRYRQSNRENFGMIFDCNTHGYAITTPVRAR